MSDIGRIEKETQKRVIRIFKDELKYTYLGDWHDRRNSNIEEEYLNKFLRKQGYSKELIDRAIRELKQATGNQQKTLFDINKDVYSLLRYGAKVRLHAGEKKQTVNFINWEKPFDNDFYIAEEVTVLGNNTKRPDLVIYVNGIALGIIELKRSTVSVSQGIRQNLDNQKDSFIKPFFATVGLVCAGNDSEGLRYGVIETTEKYYLTWKKDDKAKDKLSIDIRKKCSKIKNKFDQNVVSMFTKARFLELLHSFSYEEYLRKIVELTKNVQEPESSVSYPEMIKKSSALRALYDNYSQDESVVLKIHETVIKYKQDSFRGDPVKERKIMRALRPIVSEDEVEYVLEIIKEQGEY